MGLNTEFGNDFYFKGDKSETSLFDEVIHKFREAIFEECKPFMFCLKKQWKSLCFVVSFCICKWYIMINNIFEKKRLT